MGRVPVAAGVVPQGENRVGKAGGRRGRVERRLELVECHHRTARSEYVRTRPAATLRSSSSTLWSCDTLLSPGRVGARPARPKNDRITTDVSACGICLRFVTNLPNEPSWNR